MTTDQSLFKESTDTSATTDTSTTARTSTQNENPLADLLGSIRNERGEPKYGNVPEALVGLKHSQDFIQTLKNEKAELERKLAEYSGRQSQEDELKRSVEELTRKYQEQSTRQGGESFTPEQIAEMVNRQLTEREVKQSAAQNQKQVVSAVQSAFGTDAEAKYNAAAEELGLTVAEMNALAAKSPKAVLKALGITGQATHKQQSIVLGSTALNSAAFTPRQETFVKRNETVIKLGATTQDLNAEFGSARSMVEELHEAGLTTDDLTSPKNYFKYFGKAK